MSHDDPKPPASSVPSKPTNPESHSESKLFPGFLAVGFAGVIVASWFAQAAPAPVPDAPPLPATSTDSTGADAAAAPTPTPVATETPAITAESVKAELDALVKKIDELAKPEPPVDLTPIQEQVAALAKSVEPLAALPKMVEDLTAKLAESEKVVEALKAEFTTTKDDLTARIASIPAPSAAPTATPAAPAVDPAAMTSAVDLFKANKFAEALEAFKTLPADDARVLYYTALATGLNTKSWAGETEKIVLQGVEREKAGSPASGEIDAALAGLTEQQGKAWLAFYRAKAK